MPTVPEQVAPNVAPSELPSPQISRFAYSAIGSGGEELQRAGNAVVGIGRELGEEVTNTLDLANRIRVNDALNQLREQQLTLTYGAQDDPSTGYLAQQGKNALERPNGQSLAGEYTDKLQTTVSDLADSLGNDAQRQLFNREAANLVTGFQGDVQRHTLQQFHDYALETQSGTIKLAQNAAALGWSNPDGVRESMNQAAAAVVASGRLMGKPASEIEAERQQVVSGIHTKVIESALENNNPSYAMQYMNTNKSGMTADDILRVQGKLNRDVDSQVSQMAVTATTAQYQPAMAPGGMDRFANLIMTSGEGTGGKDFRADGSPITSPKGAKYAMQVMPDTAANPGYGVKPAQSDTPDEYNRVGRQLLGALVQKYGNVPQAAAAYNAGAGAVDAAITAAKSDGTGNWLAHLSNETQGYVQRISKQYNAGQGAPQLPTKEEFVQAAVSRLGENPRPEQVTLTQNAAERQYGVLTASVKEQGDQALADAQRALIANGGDFNALDSDIKTRLAQFDPGKYDDALKFGKAISKGDNESDPTLYASLATYPDEMAKLSDAQFTQLRMKLSEADFKHFANERANILNGKTDNTAGVINTPAFNTALNERLNNIGINTKPAKDDTDGLARLGEIQKFVRDDVFAQQQQLGRKLTPQEISERVDTLFAKSVTLKGFFSDSVKPVLGMEYSDIPSEYRAKLETAMPNATENDRLYKYQQWAMKNGR